MFVKKLNYVIGVDGGGAKTVAVLADLRGRILKMAKTGSSNPRNVGVKTAAENIAKAIRKILPNNKKIKISRILIGLAAMEEEYRFKKEEIEKEILKYKEISSIFNGKVIIRSDQIVAFRSGTDKKNGIVLIAGSGCVAHGWKNKKEVKASGWGWLADEGSGFWIGQKAIRAIFRELDGRGLKTKITKLIFKEWKLKNKHELMQKVYSGGTIRNVSLMSETANKAAEEGDKVAKLIMEEAGKELALSANSVIKKLRFQKQKFPLVLIGRVFKSKIILQTLKKRIKTFAPGAEFIIPKKEPVVGAVKLAIGKLKK